MFNVGLSEILVVLAVGCLVIDPAKIPDLMRDVRLYYRKFVKIRHEVAESLKEVYDVHDSDDLDDSSKQRCIVGDDGNVYEAYEVKDLVVKKGHEYDSQDTNSR